MTATNGPDLTATEQQMLDGARGEAVALAMRIVLGVARVGGAGRLLPVQSAHVDGCLYHGRAGLEFAERLAGLGGQVAVRTTLNVGSLDLLHPGLVDADHELSDAGNAHAGLRRPRLRADLDLRRTRSATVRRPARTWHGRSPTPSLSSTPVLGARTDRYGDFLDIAAALTGRVPDAGLHRDEHRSARLVLDCSGLTPMLLEQEAAWAALGGLLGDLAGTQVAALTGLPGDLGDDGTTEDRLKALGATAASAGGVALFHVVGVTPEAPDLDAVLPADDEVATVVVDAVALRAARDRLSTAAAGRIDAVSLGTPHFSVSEFARLAALVGDGPRFDERVDVYVSTSRAVLEEAGRLGYVEPAVRAGARIVTDTCTYVTPVLRPGTGAVMTSSGKWAWYAPANLGIDTVLGSLAECVASAREGRVVRDERVWG